MKVAIYLRKSRADEEVEKEFGVGETLAKHRKALFKYAKENKLDIEKVYEEIASGESLLHRPEMLQLLKDIGNRFYDAVLVMDTDRLGRGNMQEQGLILETFKSSNTKIITLRKTYDLNNDFDEEYSEFEAFMARKELKMINRRLQSGRVRSVEEGNYIGTLPPYGYVILNLQNGRTLTPHADQSPVVKLIFDMYVNKNMGLGTIAKELTQLSYPSYTGIRWTRSTIGNIIKNKIYIGEINWKKKQQTKSKRPDKKRDSVQRPVEEWVIAKGKHEPIVDISIFNKAQEILQSRYHVPYNLKNKISNPLAGLIICKICGNKMKKRPYGNRAPHIICDENCGNKSSKFEYVEKKLLQALDEWLSNYEINSDLKLNVENNTALYNKNIASLEKEIGDLKQQKLNLHDLLEKGVYDINTFIERSKNITERILNAEKGIDKIIKTINSETSAVDNSALISTFKKAIDIYNSITDIASKNQLLKSIITKAEYSKDKSQKNDDFTLTIFPKLPN